MRGAWLIARKDLRLRLRDRSAILIGVVVPLVLAFVLNLVFGGAFGDTSITTVGYADEDGGEVAAGFSEMMSGIDDQGVIEVEVYDDGEELRRAVDVGDVSAGIIVPDGFSAAVLASQPSDVTVVGSVDSPTTRSIAEGIAAGFGTGVSDTQRVVATALATGRAEPGDVEGLIAAASEADSGPAATVSAIEAPGRLLDPSTYFAVGLSAFFVFFLVGFGVNGLLDEERDGTLARLQAAPIPRWAVVGGKALTSVILGIVALAVLALATTLLMGASWGDPIGVGILIVALTVAATSIIGAVGALARTAEGANNLASIVAVVLGMLGGTFFPIGGGNRILELVSKATPHAWFLEGIGAMHAGESFAAIVPALLALGAFALGMGLIGAVLMRRRYG